MVYKAEKSCLTQATNQLTGASNNACLELIYEVSRKVGSAPDMAELLRHVIEMTQRTLNAVAASVLLFDENREQLSFEAASGPVGKILMQKQVSKESGIAGWVARNGKPLIVNDVPGDRRFNAAMDETTGFDTRSMIVAPLVVNRKIIGILEVINKLDGSNFCEEDMNAVVSVAATAAMAIENTRLHNVIVAAYKDTIKALAAAIDAKDPYTRGHSQRVMEYSLMMGEHLGLPPEEMEVLEYAGILHDVGKIGINDAILNKPSSLTPEEWAVVREHPDIGANLLKDIPFLEEAARLVRCHHERYDGGGYPNGIKAEHIPAGACLIAVADAFDTMTTDRAYRAALSTGHAIGELRRCSGTQFSPMAVDAFVAAFEKHDEELPVITFRKTRPSAEGRGEYKNKDSQL